MSEEEAASNVRNMVGRDAEPETILRDMLSRCAEIRSRGKIPRVVTMILEDEHLPQLSWSPMGLADLSGCGASLQLAVMSVMADVYDRAGDEEGEVIE